MFRIAPVAEGIVSTRGPAAQPCIINKVVQRYRTRWRMSRQRCRTNACAVLLCFKLALCKAAVKECDNSVNSCFRLLNFEGRQIEFILVGNELDTAMDV